MFVIFAAKYQLLTISEKLYWVCTKCQTCAEVYSQKSHTVQTLGVCYFPCLWIHDLCHDFDQHSQSCHEILQSTPTVHSIPRCSQCHIYSLFHDGVCVQTGCLQIQGKCLTDLHFRTPISLIYRWCVKSAIIIEKKKCN